MELYESLYEKYGRKTVDTMRLELTRQKNRLPSYIELLSALSLRQAFGRTVRYTMQEYQQ